MTPNSNARNKNDAHKKFDAQLEKEFPSRTDRARISLRLSKQKYEQLKMWDFVNQIKYQEAIETALDSLFDAQVSKCPQDHALDSISDDLIKVKELYSRKDVVFNNNVL